MEGNIFTAFKNICLHNTNKYMCIYTILYTGTSSLSTDKFQNNIMINYTENPQFNETSICKIPKDITNK